MAQKFVSLDEAATQLGIGKERLNELREDGKRAESIAGLRPSQVRRNLASRK